MRDQLGVLLVEGQGGKVEVQLFADVDGVEKAFANLNGKPSDPTRRTTLVTLRYGEDGVKVAAVSKVIPVLESAGDKPDGYILGEGPVKLPTKD